MEYLLIVGGLLAGLVPMFILRFCFKEHVKFLRIFEYIFTIILIAVFLVRTQCYVTSASGGTSKDITQMIDYVSSSSERGVGATIVGVFAGTLIWVNLTVALVLMFRTFFDFRVIKNITKYIAPIMTVLSIGFFYPICEMLQADRHFSCLVCLLAIELGMELFLCIYHWIKEPLLLNNREEPLLEKDWKAVLKFIGIFLLLLIPTMPPYQIQFYFGLLKGNYKVDDLLPIHRAVLYFAVIIPTALYFCLRGKDKKVIHFALTFISVGTMLNFLTTYDYTDFAKPWSWPLHLCNTAMLIMPIVTIFKAKRLFYFTLFINVAGAIFAMVTPNYDELTNIFSLSCVHFYYNHYIAFFMPILCVALGLFERPKIKQMFWSLFFFGLYYILVLYLNVYFTAYLKSIGTPSTVDYFFINSDFIADKLGTWAENIYAVSATFVSKANGFTYTFHPLYQAVYFVIYIVISFGCWFIYQVFFDIADRHYEILMKKKAIRLDKYALQAAMGERSIEEPMNPDAGIKFELKHFSKKYSTSKVYAVNDANLEVFGGEIFGFLGPNGAGKSTIIKSTVGIQPISEGSIEICGYDVKTQSVKAKSLIGFVPDHYALYEQLSGREYVNYIADIYHVSQEERNERIEKYIKLFQMEAAIDNKMKTYSHGMKQKITIMSALVHNPKVWILDEPLTGLDPTSIFQVKECMKEHAKAGNIVFFSSHIIDIVEKLCERVAIIKKGQIQCVKTVKEIEASGVSLEQFYLNTIGETLESSSESSDDSVISVEKTAE